MRIADAVVHWLHLMGAISWVGGMMFISLVVSPILRRRLAPETRGAVYQDLGRGFNALMWSSWSLLLGTGLIKLWGLRETPEIFFGPFGKILAVKLSMVAAMAVLSLLHAYAWGPKLVELSPAHADYQALVGKTAFWGKVNFVLIMAIVLCAVLLRFNSW